MGQVIGLFQEREQRIPDSADHVFARKQRGIGKECWEVGWKLERGRTDRSFEAALTRAKAARLVLDVNTIIDRFLEQKASIRA